jgi:hypothetical protein
LMQRLNICQNAMILNLLTCCFCHDFIKMNLQELKDELIVSFFKISIFIFIHTLSKIMF